MSPLNSSYWLTSSYVLFYYSLCFIFYGFSFFNKNPGIKHVGTFLKPQMSTNIKPHRFSQVMWPNVMMFELSVAIFDVVYVYIAQSVLRASKGLNFNLFIIQVFLPDFKIRIYHVCLHYFYVLETFHNIFFCVSQNKESHTGLERHEDE